MSEPGLYQHYKGNLYRVLFTASWADPKCPIDADPECPIDNERLYVYASRNGAFIEKAVERDKTLLTVYWSGNQCTLLHGAPIVIYVALYGNGRLSARRQDEFEESVDVLCTEFRETHRVARFRRIGD